MRILSLDTTTRDGSAAIVEDDRVVDVRWGDPSRSHAERLPGELIALLDAHGLAFRDIDVFAVASGPGSFTGLRIGVATIQGLAFACGRRVVAVSALDALAQQAGQALAAGRVVVSWMDAFRREVFSAAHRITNAPVFDAGRLALVDAVRVGPPSAILESLRTAEPSAELLFTGGGALTYAAEIARARPTGVVRPPEAIAGVIGLIAMAHARRGETIDPAAIQPLYVRRPDAEVARERKL